MDTAIAVTMINKIKNNKNNNKNQMYQNQGSNCCTYRNNACFTRSPFVLSFLWEEGIRIEIKMINSYSKHKNNHFYDYVFMENTLWNKQR